MSKDCCDTPDKHCGRTSYGCWFKDLSAEELAELEALAKATVQGDGDFNWGLIPGDPGGVWRDQCGNEPIVYDAYDVDCKDDDNRVVYRDPPLPKHPKEMSDADWEVYSDLVEAAGKKYMDAHPDLAFIGKMHPGRVLRLIQMAMRSLPK